MFAYDFKATESIWIGFGSFGRECSKGGVVKIVFYLLSQNTKRFRTNKLHIYWWHDGERWPEETDYDSSVMLGISLNTVCNSGEDKAYVLE